MGNVAPGRAHAEARGAFGLGSVGGGQGLLDAQQLAALDTCAIVGRLRAVSAILGASAGLDAEQHAALHLPGAMIGPMRELGSEHQVRERSVINRLDLRQRPVVPRHRPGGVIYPILQRQYLILFFSIAGDWRRFFFGMIEAGVALNRHRRFARRAMLWGGLDRIPVWSLPR